jgi:hypothetical protein
MRIMQARFISGAVIVFLLYFLITTVLAVWSYYNEMDVLLYANIGLAVVSFVMAVISGFCVAKFG